MNYKIPKLPLNKDLETKAVLRQLNLANKKLAELKGISKTIPNEPLIELFLSVHSKDDRKLEQIDSIHESKLD